MNPSQISAPLSALDGLRSLSVLLVLAGHYYEFCHIPRVENGFAGLGVLLFLVLSGFLITKTLVEEESCTGKIDFKRFYRRRARRILPAFFFFMGVLAFLRGVGWLQDIPWYNFPANFLFIRNWVGRGLSDTHLWTLSLEVQFYLFWPLLLSRWTPQSRVFKVALLLLVAVAWRTLAMMAQLYPPGSGQFYMRTDFRLDALLGGSLVGLLSCKWIADVQSHGWPKAFLRSVGVTVGIGFCLGGLFLWTFWAPSQLEWQPYYLSVLMVLAIGLLALLVFSSRAEIPSFLIRLFSLRIFKGLAALSYSLYLWQQLFFVQPENSLPLFHHQLPWNLIFLLLCAGASYGLIERPDLRHGLRKMIYGARYRWKFRQLKGRWGNRLLAAHRVEIRGSIDEVWNRLRGIAPVGVMLKDFSLRLCSENLRDFLHRHQALYRGIGNAQEKAVEHALTFEWMDFKQVRRFCDVASSASPLIAAIRTDYPQVELWRQDLSFRTDLQTRVIGGFAQDMKEVAPGFFDVMTLHCSFEHFYGRSDSEFIQEVDRVLSPVGVCLILPLYLDQEHRIYFDPTAVQAATVEKFDSEGTLCAAYEYHQDHGRYYQPETLVQRILVRLPSTLKATVIRIRDTDSISSEVYLRFALVLHREKSGFRGDFYL